MNSKKTRKFAFHPPCFRDDIFHLQDLDQKKAKQLSRQSLPKRYDVVAFPQESPNTDLVQKEQQGEFERTVGRLKDKKIDILTLFKEEKQVRLAILRLYC